MKTQNEVPVSLFYRQDSTLIYFDVEKIKDMENVEKAYLLIAGDKEEQFNDEIHCNLNQYLTVEGNARVTNPITATKASLTVLVSRNSFTADEDPQVGVSEKGYVFDKKDISNVRATTMFIDNIGTAPITIKPKWDIVCE